MENKKRGGFTSNIGFILAAAGSAVGLGNLWRFPYLAAKNGGGLFLLVYVILAVTFGFALMTTEIAIGRKTGVGPLLAYGKMNKKFGFLGWIATAVPLIIFPYYCVIGGWVAKYGFTYVTGGAKDIYSSGSGEFFNGFITANVSAIVWLLIFMGITAVIVILGVEKGIEKASKIMMPALLIIILGIAIFSLTLKHTDDNGVTRTALEGFKIYVIPNFNGITLPKFFSVLLDAMGQLFYSMSLAMGIMITYGSYTNKNDNLVKSVNQIEIFDTAVALLAGLIQDRNLCLFHCPKYSVKWALLETLSARFSLFLFSLRRLLHQFLLWKLLFQALLTSLKLNELLQHYLPLRLELLLA